MYAHFVSGVDGGVVMLVIVVIVRELMSGDG